jgi:hypothetical protein
VTSLDHLLPAPDETVRCADFARSIAVDPGGTAIRADRVVLVETGLPWPKPVFDHPTLQEIDPVFKTSTRPTRLLGCQPPSGSAARPLTQIWVFDRLDRHTRERRFDVASPDELLDLASCLVAESAGDEVTSARVAEPSFDGPMNHPAVLVCTQGSHDICCGADGERFAQQAELMVVPGLRVFRVSHTGGHRFAPTAMTLPDGRMWAYLVPDLLEQILDAPTREGGAAADLAQFCRGWWGADVGPAQLAERAVFAELGFDLDHSPRSVAKVDESTYQVETEQLVSGTVELNRWMVDVELVREFPRVACRKPGGRPTKVGREYRAVIRTGGS